MTIFGTRKFIALEGIDGVGKTEQAGRLFDSLSSLYPEETIRQLREPGSTALGEEIRRLLAEHSSSLDPITELFLFAAARRRVSVTSVVPWLEQDAVVIADRYSQSTMAYQYIDLRRRMQVSHREAERILADVDGYATSGIRPGLNILLDTDDMDLMTVINRQASGPRHDPDFLSRVAERYRDLVDQDPVRWEVISMGAEQSPADIAEQVLDIVRARLDLDRT